MIHFDVVTVFPDIVTHYIATSIIGRAQKQELVTITAHDLRNWTTDKHRTIDDRVYGGGAGMLMKVEPLFHAITALKQQAALKNLHTQVLAMDASGTLFTQEIAKKYANLHTEHYHFILLCGHYEGFDARVYEFVDQKIAVGPYILTGGELPALLVIDAVTRLIPGVLGNENSAAEETEFTLENGTLFVTNEHPQYTSPAVFTFENDHNEAQKREVPEILRSGHHEKIKIANQSQRKKKSLVE